MRMKQHMRKMTVAFGIHLPITATHDQNDPTLNDINIWFGEQYKAFQKSKQAREANANLTEAFETYCRNVHELCIEQSQNYLDRILEIHNMPLDQRPVVSFGYSREALGRTV
jgi:hypothetical protein